jgi:hypothetical protein
MLGLIWLAYPLTYYAVQEHPRYRYPIEFTLYLTAAYVVAVARKSGCGLARQ